MADHPDSQTNTVIKPYKILRKSIHTFLTHFPCFTSSPALICLPFSVFFLLNLSTAVPAGFHHRLYSLFLAGDFPVSSPSSQFLILKLSETISSILSSLPLSLSFLLLSKTYTIQFMYSFIHRSYPPFSPESSYFTILYTQIFNLFILIAANSACFTVLCLAFSLSNSAWESTGISLTGAVFYSFVVANAIVICNLGLIVSGMEGKGGLVSILKSCVLIRSRILTALFLSLPANLAMAVTEVIFRCRIYGSGVEERSPWLVAMEALLISYLYSVLLVGDSIVGCLFYASCKEEEEEYESDWLKLRVLEEGI